MTGGARVAVGMSAVLAVASLAVTLLRQPDESSEDGHRRELERQVEAMRQEIRRVRAQQTVVFAAAGRSNSGAQSSTPNDDENGPISPARPTNPPDDEDEAARWARAQDHAERRVALLDATLRAEGPDTPWAGASERTIREVSVNPELAGSSVQSVECRTTICRVEVLHDSEQAADRFGGPFLAKLPNLPRGMVRRYPPDADGRSRSVVFLAREGHRLPILDER